MQQDRRKIIIITDGDTVACHAVEEVAREVGARCITSSAGNPTPLSGEEIIELIHQAKHDPILVMFDDNGQGGYGRGEQALRYVATHDSVEVLGAIAVASNTDAVEGTHVDVSIDCTGKVVIKGVDKEGNVEFGKEPRIYGDTVDVLEDLDIPIIVGVGDIGKMNGRDHLRYGCPVTRKAVELILNRSGYNGYSKA